MKAKVTSLAVVVLLWGVVAPGANGQKGRGDLTGVARHAVQPDVVPLSGKVLAIETGRCELGTGRAEVGTHLLLKTKGKKLNIHLGPEAAVDHIVDQLSVGKKVKVDAFRTEKMPANHYVARTLRLDGGPIQLRDTNFRPLWAGGGGGLSARTGSPLALGKARGRGGSQQRWAGRGCGRGRGGWSQGRGRNVGFGQGAGWGRGGGYGRGLGRQWRLVDQDNNGVCDNLQTSSGENSQ